MLINSFHRLAAQNLSWDVGAVLALNRDGFGPRGPLEVMSEQLIQRASRGELQAVSKILQTQRVHPDVADSRGTTALIVAAVTAVFTVWYLQMLQTPDSWCHVLFLTGPHRLVHPSGELPPRCAPPVAGCGRRH